MFQKNPSPENLNKLINDIKTKVDTSTGEALQNLEWLPFKIWLLVSPILPFLKCYDSGLCILLECSRNGYWVFKQSHVWRSAGGLGEVDTHNRVMFLWLKYAIEAYKKEKRDRRLLLHLAYLKSNLSECSPSFCLLYRIFWLYSHQGSLISWIQLFSMVGLRLPACLCCIFWHSPLTELQALYLLQIALLE